MKNFRKDVSLSDKTVQRVADGSVKKAAKKSSKPRRPRNSKVEISHWRDGLDERIVEVVKEMHVDSRRIEKKSPTEVIIWNNNTR
jgi:hypothetical protein